MIGLSSNACGVSFLMESVARVGVVLLVDIMVLLLFIFYMKIRTYRCCLLLYYATLVCCVVCE